MALPVRRSRPRKFIKLLRVAEPDVQHVTVQLPMPIVQRGVQTRVQDPVAVEFPEGDVARARHRKLAPRAGARAVRPPTSGTPKLAVTASDHPHAIQIHLPR